MISHFSEFFIVDIAETSLRRPFVHSLLSPRAPARLAGDLLIDLCEFANSGCVGDRLHFIPETQPGLCRRGTRPGLAVRTFRRRIERMRLRDVGAPRSPAIAIAADEAKLPRLTQP